MVLFRKSKWNNLNGKSYKKACDKLFVCFLCLEQTDLNRAESRFVF